MRIFLALIFLLGVSSAATAADFPDRLLWGDTHLHTSYSADAYFLRNTTTTPDSAYRFAKGLPVLHPLTRDRATIATPLDFLVVSDHAEWLGGARALYAGDERIANTQTGKRLMRMLKDGRGPEVTRELIAAAGNIGTPEADEVLLEIDNIDVRRSAWDEIARAADAHNDPGRFTALIGWEWSSVPAGETRHRIVLMEQGAEVAKQFMPYSMLDGQKPEDLWAWLERTAKETGAEFVAIPHNSNLSKGTMFSRTNTDGDPMTAAYARTRLRWEPVVEMTQFKGDSETHPKLSPKDEFADFEIYGYLTDQRRGADRTTTITAADYVRPALKTGLELEAETGINPFQFGMIGSTDSHTGMSTAAEDNFKGKFPLNSIPPMKADPRGIGAGGWDYGAQGLAAVWAKDNTRAEIIAALRRREVYATTGPRIAVRFFGGYDFVEEDAQSRALAAVGYKRGVPMGGTLSQAPDGKVPTFLIHVAKDPRSANLDRVQIIKGWLDERGKAQEKIYNVVWSDNRIALLGRIRSLSSTVDKKTARYENSQGAVQLAAVWRDPDFDPKQRAFYYVRALEIPKPRHPLYDVVALGMDPDDAKTALTLQDRAYSSPIWYTP